MVRTNNCFNQIGGGYGMGSLPDSYKDALSGSDSEEEIPEDCESCGDEVEVYVEYVDPDEKVYYCEDCGVRHLGNDDKAMGMFEI